MPDEMDEEFEKIWGEAIFGGSGVDLGSVLISVFSELSDEDKNIVVKKCRELSSNGE